MSTWLDWLRCFWWGHQWRHPHGPMTDVELECDRCGAVRHVDLWSPPPKPR